MDDTAAFLVYDNYSTILKWNRSTFYALAVGQLADALAKR
jgi:membrane-bound lytic murein transglycosylase B